LSKGEVFGLLDWDCISQCHSS